MFADVLVNLPVDRPFTYSVPARMTLQRGSRVQVPFRDDLLGGFVQRLHDEAPSFPVKDVAVEGPVLIDERLFDLARWIADRYACGWGEALEAVIPTGVKKRRAQRTIPWISLKEGVDPEIVKAPKQREALEILKSGGRMEVAELARRLEAKPNVRALEEKGLVVVERVAGEIDAMSDVIHESPKTIELTPEQSAALHDIAANPTGVTLLKGVTGSGKTEVYLQAIASVLAQGKQAIVLVPEIALTPQTVSRFKARFPRIAVLHSVLTEADRAAQWRATKSGEADVIIGARSAVFAPTRALGLIVVDEEHEGAYKQENVPRYHAREVAIERAKREGAAVLLGSATPALESLHRVRTGEFRLVKLPYRIERREMPEIEVVDMVAERAEVKRFTILSRQLVRLMEQSVARGEQVLLFLNRRGFVTHITCPRCQWVFRCRRCDISMTHHRETNQGVCHYCFDARPMPDACPDCHAGGLLHFGVGTERVEDEVRSRFPDRVIQRMDSDAMKTKQDYRTSIGGLWSGKIDILIGTQMIAKGLDVPNVTLVGVINADTAFHVPDFRASERTFQLITQVAGRAGRGPRGGRVVVQSFNPNHYAITSAAAYDFDGFVARELEMRRELDYPPFSELVRVVVSGFNESKVREAIERLATKIRPEGGSVLGPSPAPISKLKGRYRMHLLVKTHDLRPVRDRLLQLVHGISRPLQATLDVDPVSMM